jgi:hypothetical protein
MSALQRVNWLHDSNLAPSRSLGVTAEGRAKMEQMQLTNHYSELHHTPAHFYISRYICA